MLLRPTPSYDLPWQLQNVVPFGLYGGAPRHERHHREGSVYMQKFGTYLDEAFGFVPKANPQSARDTLAARDPPLLPQVPTTAAG